MFYNHVIDVFLEVSSRYLRKRENIVVEALLSFPRESFQLRKQTVSQKVSSTNVRLCAQTGKHYGNNNVSLFAVASVKIYPFSVSVF